MTSSEPAAGGGVTVLGSANADLVLDVARLPSPGETVLAAGRRLSPGGKGLNQAVAAARAGAATTLVAATGDDAEGAMLRAVVAEEGMTARLRSTAAATGLAAVLVDAAGQNSIVVVPGANAELIDLTADELAAVTGGRVLLVQLEVPLATVTAAARAAHAAGVTVVLNASPARPLPDELLAALDVLVVNEGEARAVAGLDAAGALDAAVEALVARVGDVVVTLGADGSTHRGGGGASHREPGLRVPVLDTTGAGDTYAGYLAAALAEGSDLPVAMRLATAAAALSVQRAGAVPAVPRRAEVAGLLAAAAGSAGGGGAP